MSAYIDDDCLAIFGVGPQLRIVGVLFHLLKILKIRQWGWILDYVSITGLDSKILNVNKPTLFSTMIYGLYHYSFGFARFELQKIKAIVTYYCVAYDLKLNSWPLMSDEFPFPL